MYEKELNKQIDSQRRKKTIAERQMNTQVEGSSMRPCSWNLQEVPYVNRYFYQHVFYHNLVE